MGSSTVTRRQLVRTTGTVCAACAGCLALGNGSPTTISFSDSFEDDLGGWEMDSDVPEDPNNPGTPVEWEISRSTERASTGLASLRYFLDGRQDDGTIWVVRPVALDADRAYDVRMRADAWSASESFNTLAYLVMYAGPTRPTAEGSFPEPGQNSSEAGVTDTGGLRETLNQVEGWMPYSFTWRTPTLGTATIYIAIGISAVWETEMTYFLDDVTLTAEPM